MSPTSVSNPRTFPSLPGTERAKGSPSGSKWLRDDLQRPNERESSGAEDGLCRDDVYSRIVNESCGVPVADTCQFSLPNLKHVSLRVFDIET